MAMMLLTMPKTARAICPAWIAERIIYNFPIKPAVGGMPAMESKKILIAKAVYGLVLARPLKSAKFFHFSPLPLRYERALKIPRVPAA